MLLQFDGGCPRRFHPFHTVRQPGRYAAQTGTRLPRDECRTRLFPWVTTQMGIAQLLTDTTPALTDAALLLGRVFIGLCLLVHGLGKLGVVGPGNMEGFVGWLRSLGFPMPELQARLAMLAELIGGPMVAIGLFTRPAAAILIGTMLVASIFGHKDGGYLVTNNPPGNEYPINLAAVMAMFILIGPGAYSLDAMIFGPG